MRVLAIVIIDARDEVHLRPHASQAVSLIAHVSIARAQLPLGECVPSPEFGSERPR
jgi:hypothetical protein